MKKGAIFDMDGLLFDTELVYNQEWYKVANLHQLVIPPGMLDALRGTNGALMHQKVNSYWPDVNAKELTDEVFDYARLSLSCSVPMKLGAKEILDYLKAHDVKLGVASSAPLDLINSNLKIAGILSYFDVIVSGELVTHGKPAPDIFLLAAKELGLKPEDCYVLEDGLHGVHAGIKAGCATIMVPDLVAPTKDVIGVCTGIYDSLLDVKKAIENAEC